MGLLDRLQNKVSNLNKSSGKEGFLKLEEGEQEFRILPTSLDPEENDPFQEAFLHYHFRDAGQFLCPLKNFNEPCAACDMSRGYWKDFNNSNSLADKNLAMDFMAKRRFYSPGVLRTEDQNGNKTNGDVVWWGYGVTIFKKMVGWVSKPKIGDFTDPTSGKDIAISYVTKSNSDTGYAKTEIDLDPGGSSKLGTKKEVLELMSNIKPLFPSLPRKTSKEVKEIVSNFVNQDEDGGVSETKYGNNPVETPQTDQVGEAYSDLLAS